MADIYMHSRLSEEVTKELKDDLNQGLVYLGAQGPDPLYYNFFRKTAKDFRFYADRMHDTNTRLLFKNMISYVKSHLTKDTYSFLVGFICHYALDVSIHPYVYHNVGVYNKKLPSTHSYRGLHLKFERSIDAALIMKEQGIPSRKMKLAKDYFIVEEVPTEVANIIGYALKQTYGKTEGNEMYSLAVQIMHKNVRRIITDRFGIKKQLLRIMDLFYNKDLFFRDLSFFNHLEDYDYLNETKTTWYHPVTNEPLDYSVEEIFENARVFALDMINRLRPYLYENKKVDLETIFTNLSFNSGLDCDLHKKMKYFNIYRK